MLWRTDAGRARLGDGVAGGEADARSRAWNGWIHGRLAPTGTYLIGLTGSGPGLQPGRPRRSRSRRSHPSLARGVTVRYLAAQPPLGPVPAGSRRPCTSTPAWSPTDGRFWPSTAAGRSPTGVTRTARIELHVRSPARATGLYVLTIRSGRHTTRYRWSATRRPGAACRARVLVVLPMLTWQGENPVDDTGGGFPVTLTTGGRIQLQRPLASGLPGRVSANRRRCCGT